MSFFSLPTTGSGLKSAMTSPIQQPSLSDLWRMVRRRKRLLILPCMAVLLVSAVLCYALPNIYRATTVILVEAQRVPEAYVKSIVSTSVGERLRTITQQIKSYTRLEEVIRSVGLLDNLQDRRSVDEYIQKMREKIEVNVKGHEAFTISYSDKSPQIVQQVTNKLASLFIEENIKVRERQATGTTEFLESELSRVRDLLEIQEKKVNNFRQQYTGELPDQQNANLRTLDRLQLQLQNNRETIQNAQHRKSLLMQRLSLAQQNPQSLPIPADGIPTETLARQQQLAEQKNRLNQLQSIFSDEYPEVKRLKREIAKLESDMLADYPDRSASNDIEALSANNRAWQSQQEMQNIDFELQHLYQEQDQVQKQIRDYEQKMTNSYKRELELRVLTRDYESTKQSYESLLDRQMQARVAENLEKRQKAEQFMVLDPARLPTEPWKPNRPLLLIMGLGLGLTVGGGLVFLAEMLDRSFHSTAELKQFSNLPVLSAIPMVVTAAEEKRQRWQRRIAVIACFIIPAGALVTVHFFLMEIDQLLAKVWLRIKP